MKLGRNQILLLVAFAGAVLANIVPVMMSFDELDHMRRSMQHINDTTGASRQARKVADIIPSVMNEFAATSIGLDPAQRSGIVASTDTQISRLTGAMISLRESASDWISAEQHEVLATATEQIVRSWETIRAHVPGQIGASSNDQLFLRLLDDTERALAVLRDIENKTSSSADILSRQVYEHLAVTAALLLGAIAIGFAINAFGSLSMFRALAREQKVNAVLEEAKTRLRQRSEQLSEAHKLGKFGDWRMPRYGQAINLGQETLELLRLDPAQFKATPASVFRLFVGASLGRARTARAEVLKSGVPRSTDVKLRRGDGTVGDFTLICKAQLDSDGRTIGLFGTIQDISERKAAEEQLESIAYYDPLTGLANRSLFAREFDSSLYEFGITGGACGLLLLDLDRFKEVNDTLGHAAGDELLTRVGHIISRILGTENFLARLGGDEFAIIVRSNCNQTHLADLASQIVQTLSGSLMLDQGEVSIGTSVGIVMAPKDGRNASDLLRNADLALYKAKEEGRGRYAFFTPALDTIVQNKTTLANDLRRAIQTNSGLYVLFQPQYELRSGRIAGFEALMRWKHPVRGEVSPGEFIPIAESSSLICDLGIWILREAARQAKAWLDQGEPPRIVSVNVSAAQIWHSDFVTEVARTLKETGLPPHLLCLELTESLMADHGEGRVRKAMKALKDLGVTLALDDFGTDYSSLGYLAQLPFDKLKIDRIFIQGIAGSHRSRELLSGIVALGRGLGMEVVAEGVETQEQLTILRDIKCDLVQGYVFETALPAEDAIIYADTCDRQASLAEPVDMADETDAMIGKLRAAVA